VLRVEIFLDLERLTGFRLCPLVTCVSIGFVGVSSGEKQQKSLLHSDALCSGVTNASAPVPSVVFVLWPSKVVSKVSWLVDFGVLPFLNDDGESRSRKWMSLVVGEVDDVGVLAPFPIDDDD